MTEDRTDAAPQERILTAALRLLDEGGIEAVSTRAVVTAAGVQAPAIYRLFGDKQGLLEAAVERGYADWVAAKGTRAPSNDPVEDLRAGWDEAIDFGLEHPAMYRIATARVPRSPAFAAGHDLLRDKIRRVAAAGRLRVSQDEAMALMQATGRGVTLTLLDASGDGTRVEIRALAREALIRAITTDAPPAHDGTLAAAANALRALLPDAGALRPAERALMDEWLGRITASGR
jgi:AcrR family transcriptional regulator